MNKFRIIAICDPYNARNHYNGQEVLKYDGATPTQWVIDDGYASEKAACAKLMDMCRESVYDGRHDNWRDYDDEAIGELQAGISEDAGEEVTIDWYKGSGVYEGEHPVLIMGETSYHDDVITYCVDSYE